MHGATCDDFINYYTCACAYGYTGVHCETDIDECASGQCLNGANCTQGINWYLCHCAAGFTGVNCETSKFYLNAVDKCSNNISVVYSPCSVKYSLNMSKYAHYGAYKLCIIKLVSLGNEMLIFFNCLHLLFCLYTWRIPYRQKLEH